MMPFRSANKFCLFPFYVRQLILLSLSESNLTAAIMGTNKIYIFAENTGKIRLLPFNIFDLYEAKIPKFFPRPYFIPRTVPLQVPI
jgi:hypothetical protein